MSSKEERELRAKLYQKINAIGKELGAMAEDGQNRQGGGYGYISAKHLNARLRVLLPKHGMSITPMST